MRVFRDGQAVAGQHCARGAVGIERIGFALPTPCGPVGSGDLDDVNIVDLQCLRDACTVGPGAFYSNGEDLAEVAEMLGISVAELIARHAGQPWQAAFAGFAPGFVYLAGGHPSLRAIARRASPRTRVPAGSVALAGDFSAVYPAASPGGWQLIGVTEVPMWDLRRAEPAFVQPGFQVQFIDAGAPAPRVSLPAQREAGSCAAPAPADRARDAIEFESTGLQTLVQDAGRHGMAGLGISPSGALDQPAMRQANRLVGNPVHTPVLESVPGGLRLRCHGNATLAVTGAAAPTENG